MISVYFFSCFGFYDSHTYTRTLENDNQQYAINLGSSLAYPLYLCLLHPMPSAMCVVESEKISVVACFMFDISSKTSF